MFIVLAVLASPFILGAGWFAYQMRPGSEGKAVTVAITKDMGTGDVADLLADKGVIDSALAFKLFAMVAGPGPYDEGSYQLHEGQGIRSALKVLKAGRAVLAEPDVKLLLPPGLTNAQIAERVGRIPGHSAAKFLEVVNSNTIRSKFQPPEVTSLEGLLFPDTYFVGAKESEEAIARRLVARFDEIGDKIGLANAQGLTPYETVIAASLIQTEAKLAEDAPLISAVIRNRIRDEMQLQIDSTLCYAKGGCPPSPTNADKAIDSPYNTYKVAGLPPTPIASVTEASLVAALNPADVPYKFYVLTDASGRHAFATTLEEHNRNVAAAQAKGLL
ncbi:MAG: endolytic transglycosylase MltG [Acidimicrobiia bacterium]|nr:endolytic transglycosylase MltG [Acidimicrobiia bacterium]